MNHGFLGRAPLNVRTSDSVWRPVTTVVYLPGHVRMCPFTFAVRWK